MNQQIAGTASNRPVKIMDSVYVSEQTFDGMTVRGAVVLGTRVALIFDTLVFPQRAKELLSLCGDRELMVVYSHADWDHVWGTCGLPPVEVIAHEECARRFADSDDVEKNLAEYRERLGSELPLITLVSPHRTFKSDLTIDLGGLTVELHHCPGHTKDSILAIVPELGLLLGADCIEKPLPILNEGPEYLLRWVNVLSDLEADARIITCVPSHGEIGGKELLRNNIEYLNSLLVAESEPLTGLSDFYAESHRENRVKTAKLRDEQNVLHKQP